jgi:hypothetical protein
VLRAVALTTKEGTADYEWALRCYLEATVPPTAILTDADPGCTAAIAILVPRARHLWCMWHIHQNLRKNLMGVLGKDYGNFSSDFKSVQRQVSKEVSDLNGLATSNCSYQLCNVVPQVFDKQYDRLREVWPQATPYLDEQLSPNVRFWAGYRYDTFTAGAVSTQRGEGLNRHIKHHLSLNSPLVKLFTEVLIKEAKENARATITDAQDQVSYIPLVTGLAPTSGCHMNSGAAIVGSHPLNKINSQTM